MKAYLNYKQLKTFYGLSDKKIAKIKKRLCAAYRVYMNDRPAMIIGGHEFVVEVDESFLSKRGEIRCPTNSVDIGKRTKEILGVVDRNEPQN